MNIGFDLDRIFINYPPFVPARAIDYFHQDHSKKRLFYRIPKTPLSKFFRRLIHCSPMRPKIAKNIRFIQNFPYHNPHKPNLYLISSRYKTLEDITRRKLKEYNLVEPFDAIYLNIKNQQPHIFKAGMLKKLKINLFVDDNLLVLKYLKKHCPKTQLLWYNPYTKEKDEEIPTITGLEEIKHFLK